MNKFPFDPLGLDSPTNAEKEIKNGRLAMVSSLCSNKCLPKHSLTLQCLAVWDMLPAHVGSSDMLVSYGNIHMHVVFKQPECADGGDTTHLLCLLTRSFTCSFTHSLTHSLTHPRTHSLTHSLTQHRSSLRLESSWLALCTEFHACIGIMNHNTDSTFQLMLS